MLPLKYSVVICTYMRPTLCGQTISKLAPYIEEGGELIVVDQTPQAQTPSQNFLQQIDKELWRNGRMIYIRLSQPSLVKARNRGLQHARGEVVIFLDDDVVPSPSLLKGHLAGYADPEVGGVAGRILNEAKVTAEHIDARALDSLEGWWYTHFNHAESVYLMHAQGCNMSFLKSLLIEIGGFDTHYRFAFRDDSDISFRVRELGYKIRFAPEAELIHLEAREGGTRLAEKERGIIERELASYRHHFRHYRDNLYFLLRHFRKAQLSKWIWKSYCSYVGVSRWPWRLIAKNICFLLAFLNALFWVISSRPPYFEIDEGVPSAWVNVIDSEI